MERTRRERIRGQILQVLELHGPKKRNPLWALIQLEGITVEGVEVSQQLQQLKKQGKVERGNRGWYRTLKVGGGQTTVKHEDGTRGMTAEQLAQVDLDRAEMRLVGTLTGRIPAAGRDTMQEFACTRNGQIYLANVTKIAAALTTLADYVTGQAAVEVEDKKFELREQLAKQEGNMTFLSIINRIEAGEEPQGLSPNPDWNHQLFDYLARLEVEYWIWPHLVTHRGVGPEDQPRIYNPSDAEWIAGREPRETDFDSPEAYNAAMEAVTIWQPNQK